MPTHIIITEKFLSIYNYIPTSRGLLAGYQSKNHDHHDHHYHNIVSKAFIS